MSWLFHALMWVMMRFDDFGRERAADWLRDGPLDALWARGVR